MEALQRNSAVTLAGRLCIPFAPVAPPQGKNVAASVLKTSAGYVAIAEPSASTARNPAFVEITPFNPVDRTMRIVCALLAGFAASASMLGTLALTLS